MTSDEVRSVVHEIFSDQFFEFKGWLANELLMYRDRLEAVETTETRNKAEAGWKATHAEDMAFVTGLQRIEGIDPDKPAGEAVNAAVHERWTRPLDNPNNKITHGSVTGRFSRKSETSGDWPALGFNERGHPNQALMERDDYWYKRGMSDVIDERAKENESRNLRLVDLQATITNLNEANYMLQKHISELVKTSDVLEAREKELKGKLQNAEEELRSYASHNIDRAVKMKSLRADNALLLEQDKQRLAQITELNVHFEKLDKENKRLEGLADIRLAMVQSASNIAKDCSRQMFDVRAKNSQLELDNRNLKTIIEDLKSSLQEYIKHEPDFPNEPYRE